MSPTPLTVSMLLLLGALGLATPAASQCPGDPGFTLDMPSTLPIGQNVQICMSAPPGFSTLLAIAHAPGPTQTPFGSLCLGPPMIGIVAFPMPPGGTLCLDHFVECDPSIVDITVYLQFVAIDPGDPGSFGVSNGVAVTTVDLGCTTCTGRIGDFVFHDQNGNAVQDPGEPGVSNVMVLLKDETGTILDATITGANGIYGFQDLCAGCYTVEVHEETIPEGMSAVLCDQGGDDALDSDCSPAQVCLPTDDAVDETTDFGFAVCGPCAGKVSSLSLRYFGEQSRRIRVEQQTNSVTVFSGFVHPGDVFSFFGAPPDLVFGKEVRIYAEETLIATIHTSCSKPVGPGLVINDFEIVSGASLLGGLLCDQGDNVCGGGKPQVLDMVYTGADCSATSHSQDPAKVSCSGDPAVTVPVEIIAYKGEDVWFSGTIQNLGGTFAIDAKNARKKKLGSATFVDIYDLGGNLLQAIEFHTSCSQPLEVGDQFGSLRLAGFTPAPQSHLGAISQ